MFEAPGESCCPVDEHAEIIEALARQQAEVADRTIRAHLVGIEQRLRLDRLPERTVDLQEVLAAGRRAVTDRRRGAVLGSRRARTANALAPGE